MAQGTITEALAELKTIAKRVEKKRELVRTYLHRQEMFKDPLAREGGSLTVIRRELQAIDDLEERSVAIRRAIRLANERTTVTVGKQSRTIADWIVWRRDVAPKKQQFLATMRGQIDAARQEAARKGVSVASGEESARPSDIVVNVNEQDLAREIEGLEEVLGGLDGQLSLKNATIIIDV